MSLFIDELNTVEINGVKCAGCSYKGITFWMDSSTTTDGRRISVKEYPGSDVPFFEDLGRSSRSISVNGMFIDGTKSSLDQYEAASKKWNESAGAGTLIHPMRKQIMQARSGEISVPDGKTSGVVSFSITFYIESTAPADVKQINYENKIKTQNTSILATLQAQMEDFFSILNAPQSLYDSALQTTRDVLSLIESAKTGLRETAGYINKLYQLRQNLETIILDAASLGEQLIDLVTASPTGSQNYSTLLSDGLSLAGSSVSTETTGVTDTALSSQDTTNKEQLNSIMTIAGLTVVAENSLYVDIESVDDAQTLIDNVKDTIDNLMLDSYNYELFEEVDYLKTLIIASLEQRAKDLPAVREYSVRETETIMNVAQNLYNSFDDISSVITRNSIDNPFFIPSNSTLEVLV